MLGKSSSVLSRVFLKVLGLTSLVHDIIQMLNEKSYAWIGHTKLNTSDINLNMLPNNPSVD